MYAIMSSTPRSSRGAQASWRPWESPEELVRRPLSPLVPIRKQQFTSATSNRTNYFYLSVMNKVVEHSQYSKILQSRLLSLGDISLPASCEGTLWLEVTSKNVEVRDTSVGPIHSLRLVVSSSNVYQLQVTWPVIRMTKFGVLQDEADFEKILDQLLPESNFAVCPGISDYQSRYSALIRHATKNVKTISVGEEVVRYEALNCLLWHQKTDSRVTVLDRSSGMCTECKKVDRALEREARYSDALTSEEKIMRTFPTSNYPLSLLSPASQKVRIRRLMNEQKALNIKLREYEHFSASLDDEQSDELAAIVQIIDADPSIRAELDQLFLEADEHAEGHGTSLQEMWEADAAAENFMNDQQRYSKTDEYDCMHGNKINGYFIATGSHNNRWNMITYRMALAVYSRSPAAYEALKSFKILQLPCKSSLQVCNFNHFDADYDQPFCAGFSEW